MAGEERSDAPGRAWANPRGLEDSATATQTTHPHIRVHFPDSLLHPDTQVFPDVKTKKAAQAFPCGRPERLDEGFRR